MSELEDVLNFIKKIERENFGKSAYEIANKLRGYTKKEYTTPLWSTVTGYKQRYIEGKFQETLNRNVALSGKLTDFSHFIAALSDQINQPGANWSDLTSWTGDHTAWAGDIGSAIIFYYSKADKGQDKTLEDYLNRLAGEADYRANIAAYVVANMINSGRFLSISQAVIHYNQNLYSDNIRIFIKERFQGNLEGNYLKNATDIEAEVRRSISTFIRLYSKSDLFKSVKNLLQLKPRLELKTNNVPSGVDLLQGSLHFLTHLVREGSLDNLKFKPYQLPGMPWLGTVNYEVIVSS
ncbi:MAG TPA: hypothetical protein V6C91_19035 [Coleofasciculaceae cyanobacterium]